MKDHKPRICTRKREGQTLIIALFVTFILIFLGLLFAGIIAHNLFFTNRAQSATSADNFAESGVRYADQQLLQSPLGADWRPVPANLDPTMLGRDPDYQWLQTGGPDGHGAFTRILFDQGRALIRVSYDPHFAVVNQQDPRAMDPYLGDLYARYLKIESVGRVGVFRANDPTMLLGETTNLWREKIAYVPIGITDYARFVTNIDRIPRQIELGYPTDFGARFGTAADNVSVPMIVGDPVAMAAWGSQATQATFGGPIRTNGGLRVLGDLRVFLNPSLGDKLLVAGDISIGGDPSDPNSRLQVFTQNNLTGLPEFSSASASFSTFGSVENGATLVRDGRRTQDSSGYSRGVEYLDPPIMNEVDPATGRERYRAATRFSGKWVYDQIHDVYYNTGRLGYGEGIYIENTNDAQADAQAFAGGQSLMSEWLNPAGGSPNWLGPYYVPPGCFIQLLPDGFTITRNSHDDTQTWRTPLNVLTSRHSVRFTYVSQAPGSFLYNDFTGAAAAQPFNGVIYCEGNVRIRGVIPVGHQLTIVSNATIYVEGSIIKGKVDPKNANEVPTAALSLLAHDYICVNTTQFVGPAIDRSLNYEPDPQDIPAPYHIAISQGKPFTAQFAFGQDPVTYTAFAGGDTGYLPRLYVRHAAEPNGQAYVNWLVNGSLYWFANQPPNGASPFFPPQATIPAYGLTDVRYQVYPMYEHASFPLYKISAPATYQLAVDGTENALTFESDSSLSVSSGNRLYWLSAAIVQPMDVRIEALMYAQTGSFFVIPGPWLNMNPNDRRDVFNSGNLSQADRAARRLNSFGAEVEFPFYGEPVAVRITINGAIAENFPPPTANQEEWMRHWAWMPQEFGASGEHIPKDFLQNGLANAGYEPNVFIKHDPTFTTARAGGVVPTTASQSQPPPLRQDQYGRPLPATPMLPVSPRLLYFGEVHP